jgi:bifunctional UDP-N-acetylglucosamine pyrophosphorylase/glucosamine-1-phosphate N-acetyltransferase
VTIYPFTIVEGRSKILSHSIIGPFSRLRDVFIGQHSIVDSSTLFDCVVESGATVGPYSYIRPGTVVKEDAKVGTFVEVKKSIIGNNSKVPHLSYVGDTTIGANTNIGAGSITCNYDGKQKHETFIGSNVFVGSNTNFVAPVTIGDGAVIGAGSTITKDVPQDALAVARSQQKIKDGWARHRREKQEKD